MPEIEYFNLDLREETEGFSAHLLDCNDNEIAKNDFILDEDPQTFQKLEDIVGKDISENADHIAKFGSELFNKVFKDEILERYKSAMDSGNFFRINLIFNRDDAFLLSIPWEFMNDGTNFLSAFSNISLSRTIRESNERKEITIDGQINMLVVISNPDDLLEEERLKIELEKVNIANAVSSSSSNIKLDFEENASLKSIQNCLDSNEYHILHYIGHAVYSEESERGHLVLEDDQGNKKLVDNETIADLLSGYPTLKLIVLSGCQTAKSSENKSFRDLSTPLLVKGIPSIVSMQYSIIDESAIDFAKKFYWGISNGQPVDKAITNARKELLINKGNNCVDFGTPVIFTTNPDSLVTQGAVEDFERSILFNPRVMINLERLGHNFIGRRQEIRRIRSDLLDHGARVVIIHGFGGIGKTVTASHAAEGLIRDFDFIYTFDCEDLTIERFLQELSEFLSTNGIPNLRDVMQSKDPINLKINYAVQLLSKIKLLVILDNFESVLSEEANYYEIKDSELENGLRTLVNQCSEGIKFLFTSRYTFEFMKGRSKNYIDEIDIGELNKLEAIMLMGKLPGVQKENPDLKTRIFDKIGGHPYTINIFSKHARRSSASMVLDSLADVSNSMIDFTLLDRAYENLMSRSKLLLYRSCVYKEPIPLPGLLKVMQEKDINSELDELMHWGLISKIECEKIVLYQIHTLVRDFIKKKIKFNDWSQLNILAGEFFEQYSEESGDVWYKISAHSHYFEGKAYQKAGQIVINISETLYSWGFIDLVNKLNEKTIKTAKNRVKITAILQKGIISGYEGKYEDAFTNYNKSLKLAEEVKDEALISSILDQLAGLYLEQGKHSKAMKCLNRSLEICNNLNRSECKARILSHIATIYSDKGNYTKAVHYFDQSLKIAEKNNYMEILGAIYGEVGYIYYNLGKYDEAIDFYNKSLEISEKLGNKHEIALDLHQLGLIYVNKGCLDESIIFSKKSLKITMQLGYISLTANSLAALGQSYTYKQQYEKALKFYVSALLLFKSLNLSSKVDAVQKDINLMKEECEDNNFRKLHDETMKQIQDNGVENLIINLLNE